MVAVVQDSKDLVRSLEEGRIIEPADVIADRTPPKPQEKAPEKAAEPAKEGKPEDDAEDENGLTARQRAEFTDAMKRTISRKHRELKEAEEFAAAQYNDRRLAEQKIATLEAELAQLKKPAVAEVAKRPERKDFQTQESYEDAVVDFRVKEQLAKDRESAAKAAQEAAEREVTQAANARVARAIEFVPDYAEVTGAAETIVPPHIGDFMRRDEKFAELGYHFAKHPEDLERLAKLPARTYADVMRVGIELERISAKLQPFSKAEPSEPSEKVKGNGAHQAESKTESAKGGADPSTETESGLPAAGPSEPRETAPVIRPLSSPSASQVERPVAQRSTREEIAAWQKRNRANLERRKRH